MNECYLCREPIDPAAPWPLDDVVVNDAFDTHAHGGCLADEAWNERRDEYAK